MRLNSSVECDNSTAFPDPCPGEQPFEASFSQASDVIISICVPGNFTASPYSLSRSRQDIVEDLYIDVVSPSNSSFIFEYSSSYTVHCKASTTRGYFELGNYFNDYQPGPLVDHWPVPQNESKDFNDRMALLSSTTAPAGLWVFRIPSSSMLCLLEIGTAQYQNFPIGLSLSTPGGVKVLELRPQQLRVL